MKNQNLILMAIVAATLLQGTSEAQAQRFLGGRSPVIYGGRDMEGMIQTHDVGRVRPPRTAAMALTDPYSPRPYYAYSNRGIRAGLTHQWNDQEAAARPWHGNHSHWRYQEPTALIVPPTSAYHTSYAWGVGQVRSTPIHHQFGRGNAGMITIGGGEQFPAAPYWPSSTDQMGVYPVRAPW